MSAKALALSRSRSAVRSSTPILLLFLQSKRGSAKNTLKAYRRDLEEFETFLGRRGKSLVNPSKDDLREYFGEQERTGVSAATRRRRYATLFQFAKYRQDEGSDLASVLREIGRPKLDAPPAEVLSNEQINQLIAAPNPGSMLYARDVAILRLLYSSGLRPTELCDLKTSDVVLRTSCVRTCGNGRIVPHGSDANEALRTYLDKCRPNLLKSASDFLFLSRTGKALDRVALWMLVKKYGQRSGLLKVLSPSALRHSFAKHHLDEGTDLRTVQQLLRHSRIDVTRVYTQAATAAAGGRTVSTSNADQHG